MQPILTLFLGLLALLPLHAADSKPNFVVIMVDDMGYAGVSCFGNPYFKTPEIDRLAAEGMRLTEVRLSSSLDSWSRGGKTNLGPLSPRLPHVGFGAPSKYVLTENMFDTFFVLGKTPHDETPHWGDPD